MNIIEDFQLGELIFDKSKYRLKFEIDYAVWNPCMDLLAVASKRGNVLVKRLLWKTGWKIDFVKDHFTNKWRALFDSAQKTSGILPQISGLCWSPDGRVLAVLFQDGGVFFLETETGKITYYVKLSYAPIFFKWSQIVSCSSFDDDDCPFYNVSSSDFNFVESAPSEHASLVADVENFTDNRIKKSLLGSLLFVAHSDANERIFVDVLACGFVGVRRISVTELFVAANEHRPDDVYPSTIEVLDVVCRPSANTIDIVCKYCAKKEFPLTDDDLFGNETSILHYSFDMSVERIKLCSTIALRAGQISLAMVYIKEMFAYSTFDWGPQSESFHRRLLFNMLSQKSDHFESSERMFELCLGFLTTISTGILPTCIRNFLVHHSTLNDLKLAMMFVDTNYTSLIVGISKSLRPAVRMVRQYLCFLHDALNELFHSRIGQSPLQALKESSTLHSFLAIRRNVRRLELCLTCLDLSLANLQRVADSNRTNLKYFVRFLITLCINHNDDDQLDYENLSKEFEIHKINLKRLCDFLFNKFGGVCKEKEPHDEYLRTENESDITALDNVEFAFLEKLSKRFFATDGQCTKTLRKNVLDDVFPLISSAESGRCESADDCLSDDWRPKIVQYFSLFDNNDGDDDVVLDEVLDKSKQYNFTVQTTLHECFCEFRKLLCYETVFVSGEDNKS